MPCRFREIVGFCRLMKLRKIFIIVLFFYTLVYCDEIHEDIKPIFKCGVNTIKSIPKGFIVFM